jgi:anti-anti-sigma factor
MAANTEKERASFAVGRRFALREVRDREAQIIMLSGELDLATASELALAIGVAEATSATVIVLDLRELEFIDSSGIHAVVDARRRVGERLILVRGTGCVQRVFELCGLVECLSFVDAPPQPDKAGGAAALATDSELPLPAAPSHARRSMRANQGALAGAIWALRSRRTPLDPEGVDV